MKVAKILAALSILVLNAAGFAASAQSAAPEDQPAQTPKARTILVLDASGSMWGQIDGQNKIVIAREVVSDLMSTWDPEIHLGLTAYGHNRKGDCSDIEALVPVSANTMAEITNVVNGINPKGKTPLSEAVKQAAESLKYTEEAATVILVTDGLETCDADPCALAKSLEESGIDFTTHVVGFDIAEAESQQVKCIAENTGGQYFSAGNATELRDALGTVVETVQSSVQTDTIHVVMAEGLEPIKDTSMGFEYFRAEDADKAGRKYVSYGYGRKGYPKVPPGRYVAQVKLGAAVVDAPFEVLEGERREHVVNLNAGRLKVSARLDEKSGQAEGQLGWEVFTVGKDGTVAKTYTTYAYGDNPDFVLPAGTYAVQVKKGAAVAVARQTIVAGESQELVIDLRAGTLKFNAVLKVGAAFYDGKMGWEVFAVRDDGERAKNYTTYSYGANGAYTLTAGRYALKAVAGSITRFVEVDVVPGEVVSTTVVLDGGMLSFDASLVKGGEPVNGKHGWEVFPVEPDGNARKNYAAYSYGNGGTYVLPSGDYELKVMAGATERRARATVAAGETSTLRVILDAGYAQITLADEKGTTLEVKPGWEIKPVKNGTVGNGYLSYGYGSKVSATLPAGSYEIQIKGQGRLGTAQFDVKAGETISLTIKTSPSS